MSAEGSSRSASAQELGKLLRARRASLTPAELGLPEGRRRRTPGLRREEVSQLAAISPTYYALLEQGRGAHPSPQVLDALAAALRLNPAERVYLDALANGQDSPRPAAGPHEALTPGVAALVDRLDPHPTYVTGRRWDILAANRAACLLWTDWHARPANDRNLLLWMFADPHARAVFVDWEKEAAAQLGRFRAAAALHLHDTDFTDLIQTRPRRQPRSPHLVETTRHRTPRLGHQTPPPPATRRAATPARRPPSRRQPRAQARHLHPQPGRRKTPQHSHRSHRTTDGPTSRAEKSPRLT